jgi:hypothetical protein
VDKTYRHPQSTLIGALVCLAFFVFIDIASVTVALLNSDGSSSHPLAMAAFFGLFWSSMVLLSLYLLIAYFRERWTLSDDVVTVQGIVWSYSLRIAEVTEVRWHRSKFGRIVLRGGGTQQVTLWLGNSPPEERAEIIEFVRTRFPPEIQTGWEDYLAALEGKHQPVQSSWVAVLCGLLLAGCGGAFIYCWWIGLGVHWGLIGESSLLVAVWYLLRAVKGPSAAIKDS